MKQWDHSKIQDGGDIADHESHFFVVRKVKETAVADSNDIFVKYFLMNDQSIWNRIPRIVDARQVSILRKKTRYRY
ncbi:MAG: hypothetical protein ACRESZ_16075 [Methylococcales bacterium]